MLKPTGFWSYTTSDEVNARGKLSQLRALLAAELQQHIGRDPKVNIFQDVVAIPPGREWEVQIHKAIQDSSFIIPVITPGFLQSEWCSREITLFRKREAELGANYLVFPLHYVNTDHVTGDDPSQCYDPDVLTFLKTRQWTDFRQFRHSNPDSEAVSILVEGWARGLLKGLRDAAAEKRSDRVEQPGAEGKRRDSSPIVRGTQEEPVPDSATRNRDRSPFDQEHRESDTPKGARRTEPDGGGAARDAGAAPAQVATDRGSAAPPPAMTGPPRGRAFAIMSIAGACALAAALLVYFGVPSLLSGNSGSQSSPSRGQALDRRSDSGLPCSGETKFSEWNACARPSKSSGS